jgi:hypothetical protein
MVNRSQLFAQSQVKRCIRKMRRALRAGLPDGSFGESEAMALAISDEAVREFLQEELQAIAHGFGDEVLVNGLAYKRHEPGSDTYHSLCGPLSVARPSYRKVGVHNGPIVIPVELAAGIVEGATPALAYNVAHGYAQHDMRIHEEMLQSAHRSPPSRTTLERIAKRLGGAAVEDATSIEKTLRRGDELPDAAVAVSMGLDRTSVPMIEDRPEDAPPKPERKRRKPRTRSAPPPFDIAWRMAYVGTVCWVDADGEALGTIRYAAPACDDPRELVEKMAADVAMALKRRPGLQVGIVQDGAPEMWNRTREGLESLRAKGVLETWHEGIDRFHLMERLGEALQIVEPNADERKRQLDEWREMFDMCDSTIDTIETFLCRRYSTVGTAQRELLWDHLTYIRNNKDRMRYVTLRAAGLPVGSGVTESTCKTVIGHRAKRAGQRWREPGLRGVLTLRALHQSHRLPRFWDRLSRRYVATVEAA